MPLYEYLCGSCGHRFERIQKFSDAPLTECPSCGGRVEKQVSSPAIQFKGSGWYITDYAKSGSTRDAGRPANGAAGGESTAATSDKPKATETAAPAAAPAPAKSDAT